MVAWVAAGTVAVTVAVGAERPEVFETNPSTVSVISVGDGFQTLRTE